MNYSALRPSARRPFVVTPYHPDADGNLRPDIPDTCPYALPGEPCLVRVDHLRPRKTGPCFPLTVACCDTHEVAFTLYPPGFVPYGRAPIAPVTHDGAQILGDPPRIVWRDTLLAAALDASRGRPWRRVVRGGSETWSTQVRRITWSIALLGLGPLSDDDRHRHALALGVDTLDLLDGARAIAATPGYRSRGGAVKLLLDRVAGARLLERLLIAGHLAGLWGPPLVWDVGSRTLRRLTSRSGPAPPDLGIA